MPILKLHTNDLAQQKQSNETNPGKSASGRKEAEPQHVAGSSCVARAYNFIMQLQNKYSTVRVHLHPPRLGQSHRSCLLHHLEAKDKR